MYSSRKVGLAIAAIVLAAGSIAGAAEPGTFGYGRVATPAQIAGWDIDVRGEDGFGLPSGIRSVYFEVSSRECHGFSPSLIRRSHLMLTLPSQPGTTSRSG